MVALVRAVRRRGRPARRDYGTATDALGGAVLVTLADLVARARQKPGDLVYGFGGPGSLQHLTGEMLAARAGVELNHVPYRGSGPAMTDLVAGTIPLMWTARPAPCRRSAPAVPSPWPLPRSSVHR